MGHYDEYYEAQAEEARIIRMKLRKDLLEEVENLQRLIRSMQYSLPTPQRFKDALEDFNNYLK